MPTEQDWVNLKKEINDFRGEIAETWGYINKENISQLWKQEVDGINLFHFLLNKKFFNHANTIAHYIPLFNQANLQLIIVAHHEIYSRIVEVLTADKMILLYEEFRKKMNNDDTETAEEFDRDYRRIIVHRFEESLLDEMGENNTILDMIDEFKFVTHSHLEDFYEFLNSVSGFNMLVFLSVYKKYKTLVPLIYRVINEYYLEYIKSQISLIRDGLGGSFIIIMDNFKNLKLCIQSIPHKYVDYNYQDKNGNNILLHLATLPCPNTEICQELYQEFLKSQQEDLPLTMKNNMGNTVFHQMAEYENCVFLQEIMAWLKKKDIRNIISTCFHTENNYGDSVYDILLQKNNFQMMTMIIEYMPTKMYKKLSNQVIDNFELIEKMPNTADIQKIYLNTINHYFDVAQHAKENVLYDALDYQACISRITRLLEKSNSRIDFKQKEQLEWLLLCIQLHEVGLFRMIINKYFFNEQNAKVNAYFNQVVDSTGEPIIITAIKSNNMDFVKTLMTYEDLDLYLTDRNKKNAIVLAIESKNVYLIHLVKNYLGTHKEHQDIHNIMEYLLELMEPNEIYQPLSFSEMLVKVWKTLEWLINLCVHGSIRAKG